MGNVTILAAAGIMCFILVYMLFNLGRKRHEDGEGGGPMASILQILLLVFISGLFLVMGNVALQDKDFCAWNVVNSTTTGDTTVYGYDYECSENASESAQIFYWIATWTNRVFMLFLVGYLFYVVFSSLLQVIQKRKGGGRRGE